MKIQLMKMSNKFNKNHTIKGRVNSNNNIGITSHSFIQLLIDD